MCYLTASAYGSSGPDLASGAHDHRHGTGDESCVGGVCAHIVSALVSNLIEACGE